MMYVALPRLLLALLCTVYSFGAQAELILEDDFYPPRATPAPTPTEQTSTRPALPDKPETIPATQTRMANTFTDPAIAPKTQTRSDSLQAVYQQAAQHNAQWQAEQAKSAAEQQAQQLALSQLLPQINGDIQYSQSRYDGNSIDLSPDDAKIDACLAGLGNGNLNNATISELTGQLDCLFSSGNANQTFSATSYNLRASQALLRLPKWYEFQRGRLLKRKAVLDLQAAQQNLLLESASTYLTAAKTQQIFEQQQKQQQALEQAVNARQQAYQQGLITSNEVLEQQAQLDLLKANVLQAELQAENALDELRAFTHNPTLEVAVQAEKLPLEAPQAEDLNDWLQQALRDNVSLKSARAGVAAAKFTYLAEKMRHAPSVDLVGQYSEIDSGAATAVLDEGRTTNSSIGITLSMPLYTGGFLSANRTKAKFQHKEAVWTLSQAEQTLQTQIRKQARTLDMLIRQVQQQRSALRSNQQSLKAISQGYRSGVRSSADVFSAQMDLLTLERNHSEAQYNYLLASLQLRQLLGALTEQDLVTVDAWLR